MLELESLLKQHDSIIERIFTMRDLSANDVSKLDQLLSEVSPPYLLSPHLVSQMRSCRIAFGDGEEREVRDIRENLFDMGRFSLILAEFDRLKSHDSSTGIPLEAAQLFLSRPFNQDLYRDVCCNLHSRINHSYERVSKNCAKKALRSFLASSKPR